jgi:hypothetical protein
MANPDLSYLRAFINVYNLVGIKTARRVRDALADVEAGAYTFARASGDNLAVYNDLIEAWFGIASGSPVMPTPVAIMKITQGAAAATVTISLGLAGATVLNTPDLFKVGPPFGPKIRAADIVLTLTAPDLKVDVANLAAMAKGLYIGLITDAAAAPVLEVQLLIV